MKYLALLILVFLVYRLCRSKPVFRPDTRRCVCPYCERRNIRYEGFSYARPAGQMYQCVCDWCLHHFLLSERETRGV